MRILRAGCEVSVSNFTDAAGVVKHLLCLTRDGSAVACVPASRNGQFTIAEMEKRIRNGIVARWSDTYRAAVELAEAADQLFGAELL